MSQQILHYSWKLDEDSSVSDSEGPSTSITDNLVGSTSLSSTQVVSANSHECPNQTHRLSVTITQTKTFKNIKRLDRSTKNHLKKGLVLDNFAETIKAIACGDLSQETIKFDKNLGSKKERKMYWEESRFNQSLSVPSLLNTAYNANSKERKENWSKGCKFSKSKRVLATDTCIHDNSIYDSEYDDSYFAKSFADSEYLLQDNIQEKRSIVWDGQSSPDRRHNVGFIHHSENVHQIIEERRHRDENIRESHHVYPFDTSIEVFERKRELHPFSVLRKTQKKNITQKVKPTSYQETCERERILPIIGPGSYSFPDPWLKMKEKVCGVNIGTHQFLSKSKRVDLFHGANAVILNKSHGDSISKNKSILTGSKMPVNSISSSSYQAIRPFPKSRGGYSSNCNRNRDSRGIDRTISMDSESMASGNIDDESTSLDRLKLHDMSGQVSDGCSGDDWRYLLPVSMQEKENDGSRPLTANRDNSNDDNAIGVPAQASRSLSLEISDHSLWTKPATNDEEFMNHRDLDKNHNKLGNNKDPVVVSDRKYSQLKGLEKKPHGNSLRDEILTIRPSTVGDIYESSRKNLNDSFAPMASTFSYSHWKGPVYKSKINIPRAQTAASKLQTALDRNHMYHNGSIANGDINIVIRKNTISSARVADIVPMAEWNFTTSSKVLPRILSSRQSNTHIDVLNDETYPKTLTQGSIDALSQSSWSILAGNEIDPVMNDISTIESPIRI